ncbi:MAG: hypothetical protein FJ104_09730, partial [Deltaproteobacteria bacterium]|nr:hypothetical protein [Deltaproteobacteria bacterium]
MSSALPFAASPAAEFPCDNPLLHEGVGWMCLSLGGPPRAIARARVPAVRAVWPGPAALPAPAEVAAEAPPSAEVDPDALFEAECGVEPALFVALPLILARAEALAALEAAALEAATLEAAALEAATLEAAALEA